MGKPLFERQPVFRGHLERLDRFARERTGVSVIDQIYSPGFGASEPFDDLTITNPAIFMVEYALARTLIDMGLQIEMTLGASLGSLAAMAISEILDEYDALAMVIRMANAADAIAPRGGMIAVLAPLSLSEDPFLRKHTDVAAINFDTHFVVSTTADRLALVETYLAERGVLFQRLPVSHAFHSRAIECLEHKMRAMSANLKPKVARIPFACCAYARILTDLPPSYFWTLVRHQIRFRETAMLLEQLHPYRYVDVGPSGTLSTFAKYLLPREASDRISHTMSPFGSDNENLSALLAGVQATGAKGGHW